MIVLSGLVQEPPRKVQAAVAAAKAKGTIGRGKQQQEEG